MGIMVKIFDLSTHYGIIRIQGAAATDFLQGQLSTHIKALTPENHQFSAYCNLKGRVRALLRIWMNHEGNYYLQMPQTVLQPTLSALQQYGRFSKIEICDCSHEFFNMGLLFEEADNDKGGIPLHTAKVLEITDKAISATAKRFQVIGEAQSLASLLHTVKAKALEPIEHWKLLNIRAKIPEIEVQTIEKFLPHTLNLPALGAIDFKKGCFCGQEIIARMEYRQTPKKLLLCIKSPRFQESPEGVLEPEAGDKLYATRDASQILGTVVNAVCKANHEIEALIEVNDPDLPLPLYLEKTQAVKRFRWDIAP